MLEDIGELRHKNKQLMGCLEFYNLEHHHPFQLHCIVYHADKQTHTGYNEMQTHATKDNQMAKKKIYLCTR